MTDITQKNKKAPYGKKIKDLNELSEKVEKLFHNCFDKLEQEKKTILVIKQIGNKKYIFTEKTEHDIQCLSDQGMENGDEGHIKKMYRSIKQNIIDYKKWMDNLTTNYEQIKKNIGTEMINRDNKFIKQRILKTQQDLYNLQNEYVW